MFIAQLRKSNRSFCYNYDEEICLIFRVMDTLSPKYFSGLLKQKLKFSK